MTKPAKDRHVRTMAPVVRAVGMFVAASMIVAAGTLLNACVERSRDLTQAERDQLGQFVSTTAPSPQHALDVSFEDKVKLVGYDLTPDSLDPGGTVTLTWYWKCEQALEEGWLLFTHIADASGQNRLNHDGESVVRRLYQPGRWKAGEYVKDVQRITIPENWNSEQAVFYLGIWNGPHRLQITRGPNDGENRVRAASLPVTASEAAPQAPEPALPELRSNRTTHIEIDGKLDEDDWQTAQASPRFVDTMSGGTTEPNATVKTLWDDRHLYVGFEVADDFLKSDFANHDDHLWEADCVEIFVDPDGDGRNYFEMQISPKGIVFDTRYDAHREPTTPGHVDWQSQLRSAVTRRGNVGDDRPDEGYTVEVAIPWTAFAVGTPPAAMPSAGDTWRLNFFVMDARQEGQRAAAWSAPRIGDFHALQRFGRVTFVDPAAAPTPGAPNEVAPGAAGTPTKIQIPPAMLERLRKAAVRPAVPSSADPIERRQPGEPEPARPQ